MSIYIYVRVSSENSANSGLSEQAQLQAAFKYCTEVKLKVNQGSARWPLDAPAGCFIDRHISGKRDLVDRPAGRALLDVLQPGDQVIFYNVERAFRSVRYFAAVVDSWLKSGIIPHFVQHRINFGTAVGKLMGNVLASLAQYYSDMIGQRIREAKAIKAAQGVTSAYAKPKKGPWLESDVVQFALGKPVDSGVPGVVRVYNRVSHMDQTLSGLSMENQRQRNLHYANSLAISSKNLAVMTDPYEDESVSAFKVMFEDRPAAKRLMADLRRGDHVIVYRTDRAFRHPRDTAETADRLNKMGVVLHLVDEGIQSDTEMGRLWLTLLGVFASFESQIKRDRNLTIRANQIANGQPCGSTPRYGKVMVDSSGNRKLAYDRKKMIKMAQAWILVRLGFTLDQVSDFMVRRECVKKNRKFRMTESHGWHRSPTAKASRQFGQLLEALPRGAMLPLLQDAMLEIKSRMPEDYERHAKINAEDLACLTLHEIPRLLIEKSPSRSRSSTALA